MKLIKYLFTVILVSSLVFDMGCKKTFDLDINQNPNDPTNAPFRLLLTSAELNVPGVFAGVNIDALGFVGILANQGSDAFDLNNNSYNGVWNSFYSGGMKDLDELLKATANGQSPHFRGVAQTLKAYFFSVFVDLFGDVPYTEAFKGNAEGGAVISPKFDAAKDIYDDLLKLTDSAISNLAKLSPVPLSGDIYYANSVSKWSKLANTVKLYLLMKTRLVRPNAQAEIGAIFASGNFISAASGSEDFQFRYNKLSSPEGRHPWYQAAYATGANEFTYFSKQFMLELLDNEDPRQPYFVRRQTNTILNPADPTDRGTIPVFNAYIVLDPGAYNRLYYNKGKTPTRQDSLFLAGFFGRVRGDQTGVPADGALRAIPGSYPAGGLCDYSYNETASVKPITTIVGSGNGVFPFITTNMVQWWWLEYMLAYNVGDPRTLFEKAIRQNFSYVQRLGKESDPLCPDISATALTTYVNFWLAKYDAAGTNDNKLDVVLKQGWFSNIANGIEIYTTFRRTGKPRSIDLPATRVRQFALRLPYPQTEINLNPNAAQYKNVIFDRDAIFWDLVKFKF